MGARVWLSGSASLGIASAVATMVGGGLRSPSTYLFYGLISR